MTIAIQHQSAKTFHTFKVQAPRNLTYLEVRTICNKINFIGLLEDGKYYRFKYSEKMLDIFLVRQAIT